MKKILLCLDRNQFEKFDFSLPYPEAMASMGGNSGNNVFQFALQHLLQTKGQSVDVDTTFLKLNEKPTDEYFNSINNNYDCVVFSPANALARYAVDKKLGGWRKRIEKLKIPVFAIGLGAQSTSDYSFDLINQIKTEGYDFIKAILDTGGRIGLRGHFTAEVVERLGFKSDDYTVIGCPSLFLRGSQLSVQTNLVDADAFVPAINGYRAWNSKEFHQYFEKYDRSFFVCQEEFFRLLYKPNELTSIELAYLAEPDQRWLKLFRQDRVQLYCDYPSWANDLLSRKTNFSFGCRIHGNIVPILNGIPAFIDAFDSRVRELAEYFSIPSETFPDEKFPDPYQLYSRADFSKFNKNFASKHLQFSNFIKASGFELNDSQPPVFDFEPKKPEPNDLNLIEKQSALCIDNNLRITAGPPSSKKVVFIAHEFGKFKGHGGIASYLFNMVSYLLENTDFEISILTELYDADCALLSNSKLKIYNISAGNLDATRTQAFTICKSLEPDYIEIADFRALGLECVIRKKEQRELTNTVIVTNCHTATKECYEWSSQKDFSTANIILQKISSEEALQLTNSDVCIAPSSFMASYVKERYNLPNKVLVFCNPFQEELQPQLKIKEDLHSSFDIENYQDSFNIVLISRFEGRKRHDRLIESFLELTRFNANSRLILAGNTSRNLDNHSDCRYDLFKNIPSEQMEKILFFDFAGNTQKQLLLSIADLVVMPSTFENQPMAMIETVQSMIPIIASRYSGCADYLPPSLLFNPFKSGDLTEKMKFFMNLPKKEREKVAEETKTKLDLLLNPHISILPRFNLRPSTDHLAFNLKDLLPSTAP